MADYAALPLFTDAFLADCGHLPDADLGRYLRILLLMWRTPGCRVPDDDAWLARKLKRTIADIRAEVRPLLDEFCQRRAGYLTQKRLTKEFKYVRTKSNNNARAAKARWDKDKS